MHFGIFLSLSQKVFAEITVRNNLDFGYTAGAVNGADAYEKNAFQQKCCVNFLWLSRFLFLPEHNACKRRQSLRGDYSFRINYTIFSTVFRFSSRNTCNAHGFMLYCMQMRRYGQIDLSPRCHYHQVLVGATSWRFKSSYPHQKRIIRT